MILLISFFKANLSNFPNIHNLARAIRVVTLQSIVHVSVKIDDMRVLPPAFFPKKISFSSSSFLFFIDSNGMMMVYKENNISETKKVERKLPEDFQFPVILRLVSLSSHAIRSHVWKPPFSHKFFKDWKKLWWFRVNKRKTRSSAEVFQSICSRFLSYLKRREGGPKGRPSEASLKFFLSCWLFYG